LDSSLLISALVAVACAIAFLWRRRVHAIANEQILAERRTAIARGSHKARLQYPSVDLDNCIGCGACVRACPEDGVLQLAFGQAVVVHGARCVGHGLCAQACPTSAIALTLGDLQGRRDLPAIAEDHEAVGEPGLFLAGEITGFALVRTAVAHGAAVARAVQQRLDEQGEPEGDVDADLVVVGVGPAGLSCLLAAKELGIDAIGVDQADEIGGTVAAYPRRKLVMTQPMDLPLHGRLKRLEYTKEQLVEMWQGLAREHRLQVRLSTQVEAVQRQRDGTFVVTTNGAPVRARAVCLALGRRGTPRRLGVPGEDLPKVAYSLLDAESYRDRRIVVVGGGDSAIEAALALAEQPGNEVTLSYRKPYFSRLKAKNEHRITAAFEDGLITARLGTVVAEIDEQQVRIEPVGDPAEGGVATMVETLPNDHVFVFAGGTPPFPLLEAAGVSFDPEDRPAEDVSVERGTGLLVAMVGTLVGLLVLLAIRWTYGDYYGTAVGWRSSSEHHELLRPQGLLGLWAGVLAVALFLSNLLYLLRRTTKLGRRLPGSLRGWMNMHIATGIGAGLVATLHSGFAVRDSAGGHALVAMLIVIVAGVVGRWFYAFLPRSQNGRQQNIDELGSRVAAIAGEWDRDGRGLGADARRAVEDLVDRADLGRGFFRRVWGLLRSQWALRRQLDAFDRRAEREGIPPQQRARMMRLARRSHRLALQLAYYDDLRALLSTWRWLHRWLAVLLVGLTVVHIVSAYRFGGLDFSMLFGGGAG